VGVQIKNKNKDITRAEQWGNEQLKLKRTNGMTSRPNTGEQNN